MPERKILRIRPSLRRALAIAGIAVVRVDQPAGEATHLHGHDLLEMGFVEQGELAQELPGRTVTCAAGSLLAMPVGSQHAYRVGPDGSRLWNIIVDPERLVRPALPAPLAQPLEQLLAATGDPVLLGGLDLAASLAAIHREQIAEEPGWVQAIAAHTAVVAVAIARAMLRLGGRRVLAAPSPIDALCHDIEADPARAWSMGQMCGRARLGRGALIRAFARDKGCSPARFVRQARLRLARAQIVGGASLRQAAAASGYGSVSALVRAAHRTTGSTPAAWRGGTVPARAVNGRRRARDD